MCKASVLRGRVFKPLVVHTRKVKGTAPFTNVLRDDFCTRERALHTRVRAEIKYNYAERR